MEDNCDDVVQPRPRIIDTTGNGFIHVSNSQKRRRRRKRKHTSQSQQEVSSKAVFPAENQWPLEAAPILRSVLEYGRRTSALGANQAALALSAFAARIRDLGMQAPELEKIASDAESEASRLKELMNQVYEEDD